MANQPTTTEYTELSENRERTNNIVRVLNILSILDPLIAEMERLIGVEKRFQMLLYEPELLFKYRKDWAAFLIAFRLYNNYRSAKIMKAADVKNIIEQIKLYDTELAEDIEKIFPLVEEGVGVFSDLLNELRKGKEYFVSYISTHLQELITKAKSIKDAELSKKLVALFSSISGHEVEYLVRYRLDADNWPNYVIGNGIDFFIRKFNLFIKGGFEGDIRFMGLYKDFGDAELTRTMLKNNAIRSLWTYQHQSWYINYLIQLCKKSETSGRWEGFFEKNGFWGEEGDAKGKNFDRYAEQFLTKYGNEKFRDTLMAQKHKIGESPEGWGGFWEGNRLVKDGELPRLLRILQHPSYQRQKIILPAAQALHGILQDRENQLRVDRDKHIGELIRLLQEAEGIGIEREKVIKRFKRLLWRRKKSLLGELSTDIAELTAKASAPLSEYDTISKEQERVIGRMTPIYLANATSKFVKARNSQLVYKLQQLATGQFLRKRDIRDFTFTLVANKLAEEAQFRKITLERLGHLTEEDFDFLQKLIPRVKAVIRKLTILYGYIRFKMQQKYTIKVEGIQRDLERLEQDLKNLKNKTFEVAYVRGMLNRLI